MSLETKTRNPVEYFGENVFDDRVMRERLPKETYRALKQCVGEGLPLTAKIAEVVANAMKDWAISKGATHYTHWFQPLNGFTAEKHESFISPIDNGGAIMEFSGKMLIKGESDASSFPSGGLRAVFEARGYTMWDPTSPAFLKEDRAGVTLCIPTAFCAWSGEALDEKTPLLRSVKALNKHALRLCRLFGDHDVKQVHTSVGAEQEYFLIDLDHYRQRKDLVLTGRTLFGAKPSKTQEMSDHYYAGLNEQVAGFMKEIDEALWKMGVSAKTKHNEAAPCQHELAPIFSVENISADQNQLIMETLQRVALKHNLACLLHEKPFEYINGSGKHNNWSITTDNGQNLLEPGDNPYDNAKFVVFLCAVIQAIDKHAGLLRVSAASASNDHRLGGYEAPPAVISICLGEPLSDILKNIACQAEHGEESKRMLDFGVPTMPQMYADSCDRNRTSPFAFTGNKFEFRMLGSSQTISWANTILNTIVAETLDEFATRLEGAEDFDGEIQRIIADVYENHSRVIFNGNGYSQEWMEEAARRGLPTLKNTVEAAKELIRPEVVELFDKYDVYDRQEMAARYDIMLDIYTRRILIEARTMAEMARTQLYPAISRYLTEAAQAVKALGDIGKASRSQQDKLDCLISLLDSMDEDIVLLTDKIGRADGMKKDHEACAAFCAGEILPAMNDLRVVTDRLESMVDSRFWPIPTYSEILFNV